MGAETSLFKKCVIDSEVQHKCKDYSLFTAKYDSHKFSVFLFNDNNFAFDITHWKTIRHPFVVKYYDCGVFRGKRCVVTEWLEPIRPLLSRLDKDMVISGLHDIARGLDFVHSTCRLSVNNLSLDSIFVNRSEGTNSWKIGSLLCLSSVQTENNEFSRRLLSYHNYLGTTNTLPVEDLVSDRIQFIQTIDQIHRRDTFALGLLIKQLLTDIELSEVLGSLRSEVIGKRPQMKTVFNDKLFVDSDFVQIKSFLTSFVSYNENEKKVFFDGLVERLRLLSDNLVVSLVSVIVNSRLIMSNSEAHNKLLPFVLIPANDSDEEMLCTLTSGQSISLRPLLKKKIFKSRIIPLICKLYCIRDLRIRLLLLQYLPNYATFISKPCLRQLILPQILLAMKDSNDELVSLTFKSISLLVDIFGASVVLGPRLKLFNTGIPKVNSLSEDLNIDSPNSSHISEILVLNNNLSEDNQSYPIEEQNQCNGYSEKSNIEVSSLPSDDSSQTELDYNSRVNAVSNTSTSKPDNECKSKKYANIRNDLDIKELDFNLDDNQIDDLFSDMEPVFKFNKSNVIPEVLDSFKTTSSIFAATEDNTEEMGWNDPEWDQSWDKEED